MPTKNGSDRAVGKVLTRTNVSSAKAAAVVSSRATTVAKLRVFMERVLRVAAWSAKG
jgi:hypothetical protein